MVKILHDLKDPRLWYLRYIPYFGSCRILAINRMFSDPRGFDEHYKGPIALLIWVVVKIMAPFGVP